MYEKTSTYVLICRFVASRPRHPKKASKMTSGSPSPRVGKSTKNGPKTRQEGSRSPFGTPRGRNLTPGGGRNLTPGASFFGPPGVAFFNLLRATFARRLDYAYYIVENWPAERFNSPGLRPNGVSDPELSCCYYGFSLIIARPQGLCGKQNRLPGASCEARSCQQEGPRKPLKACTLGRRSLHVSPYLARRNARSD